MENDRYNVLLLYDPENLEIHHKVVACLSRLSPKAARRLEKEKITGRMMIKQDADLATARRFQHIFHDTGAHCSVRKMLPRPVPSDRGPAEAADRLRISQRKSTPRLMKCPNCGHQQHPAVECRACGIIISKARVRRESAQLVEPPPRKNNFTPSTHSRILNEAIRNTRPLATLWRKYYNLTRLEKSTGWAQKVADRLIRCGIVSIIALVFEVGLLFLFKMFWFLYIATATGQHFIKIMPEQAEMFQCVAHADPLTLGWDITLTVLYAGLLLGCAAQVLHLIRYLYESQHIIGKLVLWFVPFMGLTAWMIGSREPFPEIALASILVALPTLCLLPSCLRLAQATLPEICAPQKIISIILENGGKAWELIIKKI